MHKLVVVNEYCTRQAGSDCARCEHACPHGAISLPEGNAAPVVDHDVCNGCGICFGVCDAFASTHLTMNDLHARIRRIATSGRRAYLTCKENIFPDLHIDTNVVVLPCLSMVPPELWTLLMAEKIRLTIACDLKYCEDCDRAGEIGGELFPRAIEIAEQRTGENVLFSYRIPESQKLIEKYTDEEDPTDRRAAFTSLLSDVGEIASGKRRLRNSEVLQDYYAKRERARAVARLNLSENSPFADFTPEGRQRHTLFPRQKMLLEAVERRHDIAAEIPVGISKTDFEYCTGAGACVAACPTGARSLDQETGKPEVDPMYCVGCGACMNACEQGAVFIDEATAEIYLDELEKASEESAEAKAKKEKHKHGLHLGHKE